MKLARFLAPTICVLAIGCESADPVAGFDVGGALQAGSPSVFDASASSGGTGGLTYSWDFGDGRRGGGAIVSHVYANGGEHAVTLIVRDEAGLTDMATKTITIGTPPEPTGTADIVGRVVDTAGDPLAAVTVEVVGGTSSGVTDSQGAVTLTGVGTNVSVALRLTKDGFADHLVTVEIPDGSTSAFFETGMVARDASLTLDAAEAGGSVAGRDGATIELPENALVDGNGNAVSGAVEVSLTPVDVSGGDLNAFPGNFIGVETDGTISPILTFGVAELLLTQGGERLNLALGQTAMIEIPIYTGGASEGGQIPVWSLDEVTGQWIEEGLGTVVFSAASPTRLALRAEVSHLSWWNIDIAMSSFSPLVRCVDDSSNPVECTVRGEVLDPGFPAGSAVELLPPVGKTLLSPADVDILFEAFGAFGGSTGQITVRGAPGESPEVVITLLPIAVPATPPVIVSVDTDIDVLTDGGTITLTIVAQSNVPVNWFAGQFDGPPGNIWGGGSGAPFTETSPGVWEFSMTDVISPWAPSGVYSYSNISVANEGMLDSQPWPDPVIVTVSNSQIATTPVITNAFTDVTSLTDGGTITLTIIVASNAPVTRFSGSFDGPNGNIWGGGGGATFTETASGVWEHSRIETISPFAPSGDYAFSNITVGNEGLLESSPWTGDLVVTVSNSNAATIPVIIDAFADVTSLTNGGTITLTVVVESNVPVNFFSASFDGPNGNIWGGGSGVTFIETASGVWEFSQTDTISPNAPSGLYVYSNITVENAGMLTSLPWKDDVVVTVINN